MNRVIIIIIIIIIMNSQVMNTLYVWSMRDHVYGLYYLIITYMAYII